jgi:RimJ/RimL family protein N-acetyltransferase
LRLHGLQNYRSHFGSTYEAEVGLSDAEWETRVITWHIAGAFSETGELMGGLGYFTKETGTVAVIVAVIVDERFRGDKGRDSDGSRVIDRLFSFIISHIREKENLVSKILISHVTENVASAKAYPRQGFKQTNTSREMHRDGKFYEEVNYEMVIRG